MNIKKYLRYISLILLIILVIALLPKFAGLEVSDILEYSPESPLLAAFAMLGIYCLKSVVVFIPLAVLYISAGMLFPVAWALVITCSGLFCEMTIGYFIGKRLGSEKVTALMEKNEKTKKFLARHRNIDPSVCFLVRFSPLPFDLVNIFFGASAIKYPQFVVLTFLGLAPGIIPYVLMGDSITNPFSKEFMIPFIISAAVSICTFALYRKWNLRNSSPGNPL